MPIGLQRHLNTNGAHFITFSCDQRRPYLASAKSKDIVEDALERIRQKYRYRLYGYVLMPEHVHLLMSEPTRGAISDVIKAIKLSVALRSKQRPFWLSRYYDFDVATPEKHVEKLRYMHRNPMERGLVKRPQDWVWSSFSHYQTGSEGPIEIESPWTFARRSQAELSQVPESEGHGAPEVE